MKRERIFAMDFIRTIATIIIIIFHFNISIGTRSLSQYMILKNDFVNINLAHVGVPIFFVLSGFALMYSNEEGYSFQNYFSKRFKAIYPMYWIGWLLVTAYYLLTYHTICPWGERPSKISFLLTVVGLDGYTTPLMTNYYRIGEWFLGCIIIIYLIFPFLRWGLLRFPKIFWIPWIATYVYMVFNYDSLIPQTQNVIVRLPEFLFGMYLCRYREKITGKWAIISLLGIIVILFMPISDVPPMFLVTLMGVCCYVVCYWLGKQIKNTAIQKPFVWFAKYSFSIYLLHHVISEQIIHPFTGVMLTRMELYTLFVVVFVFDILGGYFLFRITDTVLNKIIMWKNELLLKEDL